MKARITERTLSRKPPASGQLEIWDTALPGFGLRISYGGRKTFYCTTRINGKQRRLTVGNAELIGLADARDSARTMMRDATRGIDPAERERIERREAQKARQDTFATMAELYMQEIGSKRKSGDELQRKLDHDILPALGHLPISEITRADVKELLMAKAVTSPVAANRLLALIRPVFVYAQDEERLDSVPNFRNLMQDETPRDRVLTDEELRDVWRGAVRVGYPYGHIVRLLILTAQRRGEVAGIARDELNGEGWKLPSERSKNGSGHLVSLSKMASEIIDDCPEISGTSLIFAGTRRIEKDGKRSVEPCGISGWTQFKKKLDRAIMEVRREDAEKAGADKIKPLPYWRPHDLRRTTATGMQSLGISDDVIDRVLNHVLPGVRKAYNRFARNPEKETALNAWAAHVESIVTGKAAPSNVVSIQRAAE